MSTQSFAVLWASRAFVIRCLRGSARITQEESRDDIVLASGEHCQAVGSQKVFLNAFNSALLAIVGATAGVGGAANHGPKPLEVRIEVTQGAYALSCRGTAHRCRVVHG